MSTRFMIDDAGTLIDMVTRDTFDYVSEVIDLLNAFHDENEQLKQFKDNALHEVYDLNKENEQLKEQIKELEVDLKMAKMDGAIDRMAQRPMKW